jgi:HlyD family secretion protein
MAMFQRFISVLWLILIVLSGCTHSSADDPWIKKNISVTRQESSVVVKTEPAFNGVLQMYIQSNGIAESQLSVPVIMRKSGYIQNELNEGGYVQKGHKILSLDNSEEEIALSEAHSALIKGLTEYGLNSGTADSVKNKLEYLLNHNEEQISEISENWMENVLSGKKRDEVRLVTSGLYDAWNQYRRAQLNYNQTSFIAPFSGYISNLKYRCGQWVPAGQEVFSVIDLQTIRVQAELLESESIGIDSNMKAEINFRAIPDKVFNGKVTEINPSIDQEKHTQRVFIEIANDGLKIKPGMFAQVKLVAQQIENRLLVPKEALVIRDNRELVFVVRDSLAQWCYVQTGKKNDQFIEIVSSEFGLKAGEPVVVEGHFSLAHNAKVNVLMGKQ